MLAAGVLDVAQYARLSELPLVRIDESPDEQQLNVSALFTTPAHGFTSIVVARR
jgi:hypothetical protein